MGKLNDYVEVLDFKRIPVSSQERATREKIYPYYGAQGIVDYIDDFIFDGEYILVAEDGENLRSLHQNIATWATGKFWVNNHAHILGEKETANLKYLYYYLNWIDLRRYVTGSAQPKLNQDNLSNIDINLPPRAIQDHIAQLLSKIDDKIALNNRVNATLEAMTKTLYDYWFVQFDFPDEKGRPYKTSGGKMVYNEELGREIPAGWEVMPLQAIAHIVQGNSPEGETLNETGDGMVFYQGKADFGFRFPDVRTYTTSPYRIAEKFDTLLSVRAPVGSVNMAREKCCIGRGLAAIRCDFPSFMYYTLMKIQPHLEKYSGIGTTFNAITKDDIMAFKILQPHRSQISHFEKIVSNYDKDIMCRTEENRRLAALRDWLLPMLMNGQVGFKGDC